MLLTTVSWEDEDVKAIIYKSSWQTRHGRDWQGLDWSRRVGGGEGGERWGGGEGREGRRRAALGRRRGPGVGRKERRQGAVRRLEEVGVEGVDVGQTWRQGVM